MEPCRTSNKISSHELYSVLILVLCFRFERKFCTSYTAAILNPYAFSFAIKRSCERQSNALERSVMRTPTKYFFVIDG